MAEAKKVNYTEAMTAELVEAYENAEQTDEARAEVVAHYAEAFSRDPRSIRAKLVSEGVYVAKTRKAKNGAKVERKSAIVEEIAKALGVDSDVMGSLENATKTALNHVRNALTS